MPDIPQIGAQEAGWLNCSLKSAIGKTTEDTGNGTVRDSFASSPTGTFALAQTASITQPLQAPGTMGVPLPRVDRVILYEHNSDGTFTTTSKIPCDNPDEVLTIRGGGKVAYAALSDDRHRISGISADGTSQFHLNRDHSKAYVVFDRDEKQERCLFEIDLTKKQDSLGKAAGSLLSKGARKEPKLLCTERSNERGMTPAVLDDGRIVICEEKGIHLLSPDGKKIRDYATSTEQLADLKGAHCSTKPCYCGTGSDFKKDDKIDTILATAITSMRRSSPNLYQLSPLQRSVGDFTFNPNDLTLNAQSIVDEQSGLKAMGIDNKDDFRALMEKQFVDSSAYGLVLNKNDEQLIAELPLGDGTSPAKGTVKIARNFIIAEEPGKDAKKLFVSEPSHIITALPVSTGKRDFVFAGTDDGQVLWFDLGKGRLHQGYDAGETVTRITLSGNTINAITRGGKVLSITPALEEGEHPGTAVKTSATGGAGEDAAQSVIKEDEFIVIDGLKLERHQMGHLGKIIRKSS